MQVITQQGDTIDLLCWRHLGSTENNVVEKTLELNRDKLGYEAVLPIGIIVTLPDIQNVMVKEKKIIQLWD